MGDPHLVIGIDVGMSCTGVAYLNRTKKHTTAKVFQGWGFGDVKSKVPTILTYRNGKLSKWGFQCHSDHGADYKEWFKTSFGNPDLPSDQREAVHRMYRDYLSCIYETLMNHFSTGHLSGTTWEDATIKFLFSTPADWDPKFSDELRTMAKESGFQNGRNFTIEVSITEPHAVAAFTMANEPFVKNGESILVVDAGGGTVDLCLLSVANAEKNRVNLGELQPTRGDNHGATFIDRAFEDLVKTRLSGLDDMFTTSISEVAWLMKNDEDYKQNKHGLGANLYKQNDSFRIGLPERRQRFTDESRRIADGQMLFTWLELQKVFDPQVKGIIGLLEEMIMKHESRAGSKPIDHVILSGGLGRSKYVFKHLEEYISSSRSPALDGTKVHQSSDPQLCVCLGIVESAIQTIDNNTDMFQRRISKVSLGISCRVRYKSMVLFSAGKKKLQETAKEHGVVTERDPDGHRWIKGYMDWLVLRGAVIQNDKAVKAPYSIDFGPQVSLSDRSGRVLIKSCTSEPIPSFDKNERVRNNTVLTVDLSQASIGSIEVRKRTGSMFGQKPGVRIRFYIEARIGMADVSFRALDFCTNAPLSGNASVELLYQTQEMTLNTASVNREES